MLFLLLVWTGCASIEPAGTQADSGKAGEGDSFDDAELKAQHCDLKRAGTAYQASEGAAGVAIEGQGKAPIACAQLTGFGSAENSLGIAADGSVFVAPVFTEEGVGILRSKDHGKSWEPLIPDLAGGAKHGRAQPYLFQDPATDRLLFVTTKAVGIMGGAPGFDLSISDDAGESWTKSTFGVGSLDWVKIVSGKPVTSKTDGYPNVLYAAAPTPTSTPSPFSKPEHQQVLRSLDGGESWQSVGGEQLSLKPEENDCDADEWMIYGDGVVTPNGSVYLGLRRCTRLGIAASHDEGVTWTVSDVPGSKLIAYGGLISHQELDNLMMTAPLATDSDGNLYAIWPDAQDTLRYSVSKDAAKTWSKPVAINAPGAEHVVFGAIVSKEPGTIAIAYYGSKDGKAYVGYIAESTDALEPKPTFWTTVIDDDGAPLFGDGFDIGYSEIITGGDLVEIVQVRYAPNGDVWAVFVKDMCPGLGSKAGNCEWDLATHTNSPYQGVVGRLVHR